MAEPGNTARALINWGATQFDKAGLVYAHGTDNAVDEAASLVMHTLGIGYQQPDRVLDEIISNTDRQQVLALLEKRISSRKPAAYLLQQAGFAGLTFYVDERVLVPRSPIAELIGAQFTPWIDPHRVSRVLDMCTGSGCIGIACAGAFPEATVDLSDISTDALAVASENIRRHGLETRVRTVASDVFASLAAERYDIIVVNPPYVPDAEQSQLADEFAHEPSVGLFAGHDGLAIVVNILRHAASHLCNDGILIVEVGFTQDRLVQRFPDIPFMWLEFEFGGTGVFVLDSAQLALYQPAFEQAYLEYSG